jgi:hypothetical protein
MRAAPAVSVKGSDSGSWLWALRVLWLLSAAVVALWAIERAEPASLFVAAFIGICSLWGAWRTMRPRHWTLRWDGETWSLAFDADSGAPRVGNVTVSLDLEAALLLTFSTADGHRASHVWLPLTRSGLPAQWHALRCALYSPRQAAPAGRLSS